MILEEDSLLDFKYDTTSHILSVRYPDLTGITIPQIRNSLDKLCRNVANYDIKKLLLDFRSGVLDMTEAQYLELLNYFLTKLAKTRLDKIARVMPDHSTRKYLVDHYSDVLGKENSVNFIDRSFSRKTDALAWLQEPEL